MKLIKKAFTASALLTISSLAPAAFAGQITPPSAPPAAATITPLLNQTGGGLQGTFTYSASSGQSNNFAVGTSSTLGVNASASSTNDYKVQSTGKADVNGSSLTLGIGSSNQLDALNRYQSGTATGTNNTSTTSTDSGVISGSFKSAEVINSSATMKQIDAATGGTGQNLNDTAAVGSVAQQSNTVEVKGISNASNVKFGSTSAFTTDITARNPAAVTGASNSATANGAAGASFNTSATANSNSSAYTSAFIQAF